MRWLAGLLLLTGCSQPNPASQGAPPLSWQAPRPGRSEMSPPRPLAVTSPPPTPRLPVAAKMPVAARPTPQATPTAEARTTWAIQPAAQAYPTSKTPAPVRAKATTSLAVRTTAEATSAPVAAPTANATTSAAIQPTAEFSSEPVAAPTANATTSAATQPTAQVSSDPVAAPTANPATREPAPVAAGPPGETRGPLLESEEPLVYPSRALEAGLEGTVTLEFSLDESGGVQQVQVLQSSGFPILDRAGMSQASHWRFRPALHQGQPTAAKAVKRLVFRLGR